MYSESCQRSKIEHFGKIITASNYFSKTIVCKGGHTPHPPPPPAPHPFSKISSFLEIPDVPTFHRFIEKTKVLNNSCNQVVCNFYLQSILVLEECLQKW